MFGKEKKPIKFRAIIELMGRPPEFLIETLNKVIENIEKEAKVKILRKEIFEPKETDEKNIFSAFIEMEIEANDIELIFEFMTNYLPSNIEITSPSDLKFDLNEANAIMHNIITKMHMFDSNMKRIGFENMLLKKQLSEISPTIKVEENIEKPEVKIEKRSKDNSESKKKKSQ